MDNTLNIIENYYGKQLKNRADLRANACCSVGRPPSEIRAVLPLIADEIKSKFYGCGSPLPPMLEGATILDLGCGSGRDVYIASKLAGETGRVIGVDMTAEQIDTAEKYRDEQRSRFGYKTSNVLFKQGYIEDLKSLGIEDNSIDVVISNCVINLSPVKEQVFKEIHRVLKPGGELYFSDVFADRRIPEILSEDPVLLAECLGGVMYTEDFRRMMSSAGWPDFRYVSIIDISIKNEEILSKTGSVSFSSRTVRAFKLDDLEDRCEDYGQVACYDGGIPVCPHRFDLDDHHTFVRDKPMLVCGNTASMVSNTRYGRAFKLFGDRSIHFGLFNGCAPSATATAPISQSSCC